MLEISLRRIQEVTSDTVLLRLEVGDLWDRIAVQAEENGPRIAEDDGGVRCNQKLGMSGRLKLVNDPQKRKLPLRRERGFRLIEDVDALLESIGEERQK